MKQPEGVTSITVNLIGPNKSNYPGELKAPNWSYTWPTPFSKYDADGNPIKYEVKEVNENGGYITIGDDTYKVEYDTFDFESGELTITNTLTEKPEEKPDNEPGEEPEDEPGDEPTKEPDTTETTATVTEPEDVIDPDAVPETTTTEPPVTEPPVTEPSFEYDPPATTTDRNLWDLDDDGNPRGDMNLPTDDNQNLLDLDEDGNPRGDLNLPTGVVIGGGGLAVGSLIVAAAARSAGKRRRSRKGK